MTPNTEVEPKNVMLFGETGVGKSSVINLIAGTTVASSSGDADPCTLQTTLYPLTLPGERESDPGMSIRVFDTIGLEEPNKGNTILLTAIENAYTLIGTLRASGGVDLLLFCIRAGRITAQIQRDYRLFYEIMCNKQVPLAIVVTHLENEPVMEDWWTRNEAAFEAYEICSIAHACITTVPEHLKVFSSQRAASRIRLQRMLCEVLGHPRPAYQEDAWNWFMRLVEMCLSFLMRRVWGSFERKVLTRKLERRCSLPREVAQRVAAMMLTRG